MSYSVEHAMQRRCSLFDRAMNSLNQYTPVFLTAYRSSISN